MTTPNYAQTPMHDLYQYLDVFYGDYDSFEADFLDSINNNPNLTPTEKSQAADLLESRRPLDSWFGPNEASAITQGLADAAMAGGAAYMNDNLSNYYKSLGQTIKATRVPGQSFGQMLETAAIQLGQPANQTFPNVGAMSKLIGPMATAMGLGLAMMKIYETYNAGGDWQGEAVKQVVNPHY